MYNNIDDNLRIYRLDNSSAPKPTGVFCTYDVIHPITGNAPFDNAKPTTLIKTLLSTFDKI